MNSGNPLLPVHFPHWVKLTTGLILGMVATLRAQTSEWIYHKTADGQHPDGNEQQMVWLMNRARANPPAEGLFLINSGDSSINDGISYLKVNTTLLVSEFAAIAAKPPAAFDRRLYEASRVHSADLIARRAQDHNYQTERITAAGFSFAMARVSVFSYSESALAAHGALNIDWGPGGTGGMQAGRGHRAAIMSDQPSLLSNVGFALLPESNPNTSIGPLVFSGAYCSARTTMPDHHNRFLTGTVWTDSNNNNRYDPGEGLNHVRIQPDRGSFHAVTGSAGGWAIPITAPDTYNLTFSGSTLHASLPRSATVDSQSVLVDMKVTPGVPAMTISFSLQNNGHLLLTWTGGRAPYQIQQSSNPSTGWTNLGALTAGKSASLPLAGAENFYRVVSSP